MATDHERYEQDVGAYVLRALPPLEAEVFERHLMRCDACRAELDRLRPAAEALPRSVEEFDPPPTLKASLMEVVAAEARDRAAPAAAAAAAAVAPPATSATAPASPATAPASKRRDWLAPFRLRPALAIGAIALVLGTALGFGLAMGGGGDGPREIAAEVDRTRLPGASADLEVADAEGDPATLRVRGLPMAPGGGVYEVWVERDGEVHAAGALFDVGRDGRGSAAIPGGVEGVDRVMVTRERAGGAAQPSEPPVIVAEV